MIHTIAPAEGLADLLGSRRAAAGGGSTLGERTVLWSDPMSGLRTFRCAPSSCTFWEAAARAAGARTAARLWARSMLRARQGCVCTLPRHGPAAPLRINAWCSANACASHAHWRNCPLLHARARRNDFFVDRGLSFEVGAAAVLQHMGQGGAGKGGVGGRGGGGRLCGHGAGVRAAAAPMMCTKRHTRLVRAAPRDWLLIIQQQARPAAPRRPRWRACSARRCLGTAAASVSAGGPFQGSTSFAWRCSAPACATCSPCAAPTLVGGCARRVLLARVARVRVCTCPTCVHAHTCAHAHARIRTRSRAT